MKMLTQPDITTVDITKVLHALSDHTRLDITKRLCETDRLTCNELGKDRPKSSMSHHFRVLRDAGIITTEVIGTEHYNTIRRNELDQRFPGLLSSVLH